MQQIETNSVILSRDGSMRGNATGRTRKCCVDCRTHSNACEVVWGDSDGNPLVTNWVCMGTLRLYQPDVTPVVYTIVSVQEGIDILGEHEQSMLLDAPPSLNTFMSRMFGFPVVGVDAPTMPSPYLKEITEFNNGDRGETTLQIEAWIDEAQTLVRKDWRAK